MQIRNAKIEDLKRVSYITKLSWKKPYKKDGAINNFNECSDLADRIRKKELFILVAILDSKIVGAVRYEFLNKKEIYFSKMGYEELKKVKYLNHHEISMVKKLV